MMRRSKSDLPLVSFLAYEPNRIAFSARYFLSRARIARRISSVDLICAPISSNCFAEQFQQCVETSDRRFYGLTFVKEIRANQVNLFMLIYDIFNACIGHRLWCNHESAT